MSWNDSVSRLPLSDAWISHWRTNVPRSHESITKQLNLLLPVDTPPADLPENRQHELTAALAKLLLNAAGVEVSDDESEADTRTA
jgi:hypothetical protein